MVRFLHVSSGNVIITKENFKQPKLKTGHRQHNFNIDGALYFSKVNDTDPESSMWIKLRELLAKHTTFYKPKNSNKTDTWESGTKNYMDFEFNKHNIYVVDTPDDLLRLFIKYGKFRQWIKYDRCDTRENRELNESRLAKMKELVILDQFIANLDQVSKSILLTGNKHATSNFEKLITSRNARNMPLIRIKTNSVIMPKKGITYEFLVDLIRTKLKWETIVGDPVDLKISTELRSLDFRKMLKDGYNGIYYTTNLITFNSLADEDTTGKPLKDFVAWETFINKPDIGEIPDFIPFCETVDKQKIKDDIEQYITWLASDTLMLWKWPF